MRCPKCGGVLDEDNYCCECIEFFDDVDSDDGYNSYPSNGFYDDDEIDYDSMVDNGEEICLNCTYWTVDPHGSAYGMYCLKGNGDTDPDDSCTDFIQSHSYANYGDEGQYQFNRTRRNTQNKLNNWKSSR